MTIEKPNIEDTLKQATAMLLDARNPAGHWTGELSSSALSTATALCALTLVVRKGGALAEPVARDDLVGRARRWLVDHQNEDGGWGDTTDSPTNISTTTLCWAALGMADDGDDAFVRAEAWLKENVGELTKDAITTTICERYGIDRTFSVPILSLCAAAGRFGTGREAWQGIPALPFELGAVPRRWFNRVGLPVVSYALPALIAIGQAQHQQNPSRNPVLRVLRSLARGKTSRVLEEIVPASGGFLEAAPLTSFVTMNLLQSRNPDHAAVQKGVEFLVATVREDGSWPIDTNLCVWLSTLSIKALYGDGEGEQALSSVERDALLEWLLARQYRSVHTYTLSPPGGWSWTDLSGGVPDGDDTPGALLAVHSLAPKDDGGRVRDSQIVARASEGIAWLLGLQNRDGGIPTFCRGWGKLPFDKSSPDLTAHTLRAFHAWRDELEDSLGRRVDAAAARCIDFLVRTQLEDGSWDPLWFGNQAEPEQRNPVYGTSHVLRVPSSPDGAAWRNARTKALDWLLAAQDPSGGWGGAPGVVASIEETSLAVDALATMLDKDSRLADDDRRRVAESIRRGCAWLVENTNGGTRFDAAPIGLYFAKLWYRERLYPLVFAVSALTRARRHIQEPAVTAKQS